jgi:hypothetical protein
MTGFGFLGKGRDMDQTNALGMLVQHYQEAADNWCRVAADLRAAFAQLDDATFEREMPATRFILTWMRELKKYQDSFGTLVKRRKCPPVADDFTAAVAFSLEQFLAARGFPRLVRSEETTHRARHASRPDISLRSRFADTLIATIECKTDFGWKRNSWKADFQERTQRLQAAFPGCLSYLCVLCEKRWDCDEKQWFCLSRVSPMRLIDPIKDSDILAPIEPMFLGMLARLRDSISSDLIEAVSRLSEAEKSELQRRLAAHVGS